MDQSTDQSLFFFTLNVPSDDFCFSLCLSLHAMLCPEPNASWEDAFFYMYERLMFSGLRMDSVALIRV